LNVYGNTDIITAVDAPPPAAVPELLSLQRSLIVTATTPNILFREARERRGLSVEKLAASCGIAPLDILEIEGLEGDLSWCHTPKMVQKYCQVLGIRPIDLFAPGFEEPPIYAGELVERIHSECRSRGITLEQFEDIIEWWQINTILDPPEMLLENMTVDHLQRLCQELHADWRRVILSL